MTNRVIAPGRYGRRAQFKRYARNYSPCGLTPEYGEPALKRVMVALPGFVETSPGSAVTLDTVDTFATAEEVREARDVTLPETTSTLASAVVPSAAAAAGAADVDLFAGASPAPAGNAREPTVIRYSAEPAHGGRSPSVHTPVRRLSFDMTADFSLGGRRPAAKHPAAPRGKKAGGKRVTIVTPHAKGGDAAAGDDECKTRQAGFVFMSPPPAQHRRGFTPAALLGRDAVVEAADVPAFARPVRRSVGVAARASAAAAVDGDVAMPPAARRSVSGRASTSAYGRRSVGARAATVQNPLRPARVSVRQADAVKASEPVAEVAPAGASAMQVQDDTAVVQVPTAAPAGPAEETVDVASPPAEAAAAPAADAAGGLQWSAEKTDAGDLPAAAEAADVPPDAAQPAAEGESQDAAPAEPKMPPPPAPVAAVKSCFVPVLDTVRLENARAHHVHVDCASECSSLAKGGASTARGGGRMSVHERLHRSRPSTARVSVYDDDAASTTRTSRPLPAKERRTPFSPIHPNAQPDTRDTAEKPRARMSTAGGWGGSFYPDDRQSRAAQVLQAKKEAAQRSRSAVAGRMSVSGRVSVAPPPAAGRMSVAGRVSVAPPAGRMSVCAQGDRKMPRWNY